MEHEIDSRLAAKDAEIARMQEAFALFEERGKSLQTIFESLRKDLAAANKELNEKNRDLSHKVIELEQLSSRLNHVLESLTDGVIVVGVNLFVEHCNPAAERLLGRSDIVGKPYDPEFNDLFDIGTISMAVSQGVTTRDQQRSCRDGSGKWLDVIATVSPIRSADGVIIGAVEALRDVTEIRALEARIRHQERMAALGEMAASVAHEIRNPLGTIEGFARLLRRDLESQPQHSRLADKIIEGAQNLNYVITNLLTYVRPMSLQCEQFDAAAFLESICEGLQNKAQEHDVELNVKTEGVNHPVRGDARQLRQVLLNLGINAIEACEKQGRVAISFAKSGKEALFVVEDNGCGVDMDEVSRIFDPFFTTKQGGTGLGLSLCHKIVSAHNGRIDVESSSKKGTRFVVALPE